MGLQTWEECLTASIVDGPTLTAAATASCIPANNLLTLPSYYFSLGRTLRITAYGRLSNVVTTPGTARFQVRSGPAAAVSIWDSGALNLNIVAKTNLPWLLQVMLTCQTVGTGTGTQFMAWGTFQSECVVGSPASTAGGNGSILAPVGAPALGSGIDNTVANQLDLQFTQTVATGSLTCHLYVVESLN